MFKQSKVKITTYQAELEWERRLHDSRLTFASCFATVLSHFNIATFMWLGVEEVNFLWSPWPCIIHVTWPRNSWAGPEDARSSEVAFFSPAYPSQAKPVGVSGFHDWQAKIWQLPKGNKKCDILENNFLFQIVFVTKFEDLNQWWNAFIKGLKAKIINRTVKLIFH